MKNNPQKDTILWNFRTPGRYIWTFQESKKKKRLPTIIKEWELDWHHGSHLWNSITEWLRALRTKQELIQDIEIIYPLDKVKQENESQRHSVFKQINDYQLDNNLLKITGNLFKSDI